MYHSFLVREAEEAGPASGAPAAGAPPSSRGRRVGAGGSDGRRPPSGALGGAIPSRGQGADARRLLDRGVDQGRRPTAPLSAAGAGAGAGGGAAVTAASLAILDSRAAAKRTRDAGAAADISGATAKLRQLDQHQRGLAVMEATETDALRYHGSTLRCYLRYHGVDDDGNLLGFPITRVKFASYIADYVFGRVRSSASLDGILSSLRCAVRERPVVWGMTPLDEEGAKNDIKTVQRAAPSERKKGRRLTLDEMLLIAEYFQRRGDAVGRQALAVFTVLVGLQSRGNEVLDGGLRIGDVVFGADALEAGTVLSKTHQTETTMQPKAAIHGRVEHAILCSSRALRHHWTSDSTWEPAWAADPIRRQWPAFGTLNRQGRLTSTPP